MASSNLVSLDAMAAISVVPTTVSGVFAQIVRRRLADAIAGVGTPEVVAEAAIQRTERLRAFAAARTPEVVAAEAHAEAPQAEAHAEAPQAEAHAEAPLSDEEEFEKLLRDEAAADEAWDYALALVASEAEAKAKAEAEAAIKTLAEAAAAAVTKAKPKVAEAKAYADKWPQASASAVATETAFALASALAGAVALAETIADAEEASVKVTSALAEVDRLRGKAQSAADKARKAAAPPASAPVDGGESVDDDGGELNPAFNVLRRLVTPDPDPAPVVTPDPDPAPVVTPDPDPAPVVTPDPDPAPVVTPDPVAAELPVIGGLGDIPMPITLRADPVVGAVLGALDSVTNGALQQLLQAPDLSGSYREAVARANAFSAILDGMAKGGKVAVLKTVTVGGRAVAQIAVAHIVEWRLRGSDIIVTGRARLREGKVALNGVDTAFAGVLQFDREAVVADDTELESTDFGFAVPTTSLKVVAPTPGPSNAPRGRSGGRR